MATSIFDSKAWYRLSNDASGSNMTLSLGLITGPPSAPLMSPAGSYSSENWQFLFDDGVYFIRNYDYSADYQFGVTADEKSVPRMLNSSGVLGMQWNVTQWESGDGTWRLMNGLLGFGSGNLVLGIGTAGSGTEVPAMNADITGAHWTVDINVSAGSNANGSMLSAIPSIQTPTSTSIRTKSSQTATVSLSSTSTTPSSDTSTSTSHASLSAGAIAGIAVGGLIALLLPIFLFLASRQRQRRRKVVSPVVGKVDDSLADSKDNFMAIPPPQSGSRRNSLLAPSELAAHTDTDTRSTIEQGSTAKPQECAVEMPADSTNRSHLGIGGNGSTSQ